MRTIYPSVFKKPKVVNELRRLHDFETLKGPKFREPRSFKFQQNFISIMDSVEDYARWWAKSEKEETDSLSEWVKSIRTILKSRIKHVRSKMRTNYPSACNKPEVIKELDYMRNMSWFQPTKLVTTSSLFVRLIISSVLLTNWA
jgi:hypothetical protein